MTSLEVMGMMSTRFQSSDITNQQISYTIYVGVHVNMFVNDCVECYNCTFNTSLCTLCRLCTSVNNHVAVYIIYTGS